MWSAVENQLAGKLPFVVYRKPFEKTVHAIFQNDNEVGHVRDFTEKGFVFAPFDTEEKAILLRNDRRFHFQFSPKETIGGGGYWFRESTKIEKDYRARVEVAIDKIKTSQLTKVVLSRMMEVNDNSSPIELLKRILAVYPNAFCYLWHHPKVGTWLGATPEILLQVEGNTLTTMSLAGTLKYDGSEPRIWGSKELKEQSLVTEYIIDALGEEKTANLKKSGTETIRAGDLLHLRTKITATLGNAGLGEILGALHPTPAVCGMPKEEALKFIAAHEGYDREFYSGYLGELNFGAGKSSTFYVNLRCMQQVGDGIRIYIGGGLTEDSEPAKEWEETVNKSGTMLRILGR